MILQARMAISRAFVAVIIIVVILVSVGGAYAALSLRPAPSSHSSSLSSKQGGILNIAFPAEQTASFDPVSAISGDFTDTALFSIFEPLVIYNSNFTLTPDLATSWKQINQTSYIFILRQNVKFQDGTQFNSSAVVFSINRGLQNCSLAKTMCDVVKSIVALNNSAVQFNLIPNGPLANFFPELAYEPGLIVSPSAVMKYGSSFAQHPVGTGPFSFSNFVPNDHLTLVANPNYWGGRPNLDSVVLHIIPDFSTTAESLSSGSIQIAPVSAQIAGQIAGTNGLVVDYTPSFDTYMAGLNVKAGLITDNVYVRQALNYAIDRGAIIDALEDGHAVPSFSPILPYMTGAYNTSLDPYPLHGNTTLAKSLLAKAGYPNGINITVLVSGSFANGLTIATIMQQEMAQAGINMAIDNVPFGQFTQDVIFTKNYTMAIFDYSAGVTPAYQLFDLYSPTELFDLQSVNDSEVNTLLNQLITATTPAQSNQLAQQIEAITISKAYGLFLYYPQKDEVMNQAVEGFTPVIIANTVPILADSAALGINMWLNT
jgi:peptide/nickel transport system substrate-binding protein